MEAAGARLTPVWGALRGSFCSGMFKKPAIPAGLGPDLPHTGDVERIRRK